MPHSENENSITDNRPWMEINWLMVLVQIHVHLFFLYSLVFVPQAKFLTLAFTLLLFLTSLLGTTAGAHRLWTHRSYTANKFLRFILMMCHTLGVNGPIYDWVLDHRIHHTFYGSKDDPYNHEKGFWYSHMNSKLSSPNFRKNEIIKKIDMSDIENDKIVMFQKRFYWVLVLIFAIILPVNAPAEYWNESLLTSFMMVCFFRIPVGLHAASLVNSARCIWGLKPNEKFFAESNWIFIYMKSHWHSYHYSVPWDCLTGEFGAYNYGSTTTFLKIWAALGWAKDLKTVNNKAMTLALENSIDTGKSVNECLIEVTEQLKLQHYDDTTLNLIQQRF